MFELFNSKSLSLCECPLWNPEDQKVDELFKTWHVCCPSLLGLHPRTTNFLLPHIMDSFPLLTIIKERMLSFYTMGLRHIFTNI